MSGSPSAPLPGVTPETDEERIQPAVPGVVISIAPPQQPAPLQQAQERLGTLQQPGASERGTFASLLNASPMAQLGPSTALPSTIYGGDGGGANNFNALPFAVNEAQQALIQQQVSQLYFAQQQAHGLANMTSDAMTQHQLQNLSMMNLIQRNQALAAQHQLAQNTLAVQQQLAQQATGTATLLNQVQFANAIATTGRSPGGAPPAKRQAVEGLSPQEQAIRWYKALQAAGHIGSHVGPAEQQRILQSLLNKAYEVKSGGTSVQPARSNMRVTIDKRNRAAADKLINAVDTTNKNTADEVMRRCEEITQALQAHMGNQRSGDGQGAVAVTQDELIKACGDTARYLKPYQIVGINFLNLLYAAKVGGAILADEMGLGKTAQLICYMGAIKALNNDSGPHLIVVPASLLENWQRELRRWCPGLRSVVYYGKHRMAVRRRLNDLRAKLAAGEAADDDLSDLQDDEMLSKLAATHREEAAAAADAEDEDGYEEDPLGLDIDRDDDEDYDEAKDRLLEGGRESTQSFEPMPVKWDFNVLLPPAPFNVMLTSYTLFERDSSEQRADREFLESWRWSHLIMDEAHALKNKDARRSTRLRRVANVSRRRIMMTGTPLQNDLEELQNLLRFLLPSIFTESFDNLEEMLQGGDAEVARLTERMKQLLGPFVLRRLKTEVAGQLTEKKHVTEFIDMTPEQANVYEASLATMRDQFRSKAAALPEEGAGNPVVVEKFLKKVGAKKISHVFTHLRKVAQHPLLIRHHYDDATVEDIAAKASALNLFSGNATLRRITDELMAYSDYSLHAFCYNAGPQFAAYRLNSTHLMTSAKFRFLARLLPKLKAAGSRPLIFSQWTAVLDIIEWLMDELRLPYVRLDGSTAVDERLATVDRFNTSDDVFAFLLSTRAGGQGLNLTGADTVILHDVDFNPQIDRQAEDRCHRLGQTKPVVVYRLVTKNSVDQNIHKLSQNKLKLDAAVLKGITSGRGSKQKESAAERQQMGAIMHRLFLGNEDYEAMVEEDPAAKETTLEELNKAKEEGGMAASAAPSNHVSEPSAAAAAAAGAVAAAGVALVGPSNGDGVSDAARRERTDQAAGQHGSAGNVAIAGAAVAEVDAMTVAVIAPEANIVAAGDVPRAPPSLPDSHASLVPLEMHADADDGAPEKAALPPPEAPVGDGKELQDDGRIYDESLDVVVD